MNFASYIRSIIHEYCSRTDSQRELFLNYSLVKKIKNAIKQERIVSVVNDGMQDDLLLVAIEQNNYGFNYLLGLSSNKETSLFLPLSKTERLVITKERMTVNNDDFNKILSHFSEFIEEKE